MTCTFSNRFVWRARSLSRASCRDCRAARGPTATWSLGTWPSSSRTTTFLACPERGSSGSPLIPITNEWVTDLGRSSFCRSKSVSLSNNKLKCFRVLFLERLLLLKKVSQSLNVFIYVWVCFFIFKLFYFSGITRWRFPVLTTPKTTTTSVRSRRSPKIKFRFSRKRSRRGTTCRPSFTNWAKENPKSWTG